MLSITIKVSGMERTRKNLESLRRAIQFMPGAMREIGEELSEYFASEGFTSQGGVFGKVWPRLSSKYAARKNLHYPGRPLLIRTGAMQRGFRYKATPNSVFIDNREDYWQYHQLGQGVPERVTMGVNSAVKRKISSIIEKHLMKAAK